MKLLRRRFLCLAALLALCPALVFAHEEDPAGKKQPAKKEAPAPLPPPRILAA